MPNQRMNNGINPRCGSARNICKRRIDGGLNPRRQPDGDTQGDPDEAAEQQTLDDAQTGYLESLDQLPVLDQLPTRHRRSAAVPAARHRG